MRAIALTAIAAATMSFAAAANAGIAFSFADPAGGKQLTNVKDGGGANTGLLTYDTAAAITFIIDGNAEGFSASFPNARMELSMLLGQATTIGGVTTAPVDGQFTIYDFTGGVRTDIITGTSDNGSYVRIGGTNALLFSSDDGFVYTAGPALTALLAPGRVIAPLQEAVFSLTDIATTGGTGLFAPGGVFNSFSANASFSGNTDVVPNPGALALLGVAGMTAGLRRRR